MDPTMPKSPRFHFRTLSVAGLLLGISFVLAFGSRWDHNEVFGSLRGASIAAFVMAVVSSDAPPTGVSFTRTISMFPDDAYFRLGFADAAVACEQSDHFGDNACHWDWNSTVAATLSVVLDEAIEQEDYMEGNVKVNGFIHYPFRCALCGEDCVLRLPLVNADVTIPMPESCPVPMGSDTERLVQQLWPISPSEGLVTASMEASITLFRASTGEKIAQVQIEGHVK